MLDPAEIAVTVGKMRVSGQRLWPDVKFSGLFYIYRAGIAENVQAV
jgi:hypothetical protein